MDWNESRQEELDGNLLDYLLNSKRFLEDFVCYLEDTEPKVLDKRLGEWVKTTQGRRWYEGVLEAMINDTPEREPEDRSGCDR